VPASVILGELEHVVGDRLDEGRRLSSPTLDDGVKHRIRELELGGALRHERLGLGEEDELAQPLGEEGGRIRRADRELVAGFLASGLFAQELAERRQRLGEDTGFGRSLDRELELSRMFDPAVRLALPGDRASPIAVERMIEAAQPTGIGKDADPRSENYGLQRPLDGDQTAGAGRPVRG